MPNPAEAPPVRVVLRVIHAEETDPGPWENALLPSDLAYCQRDPNPLRRRLRLKMRADLRALLSERLGLSPRHVPLQHAYLGRLELASPYKEWSVSTSARHRLGVIALSPPGGGVIGVDVEWLDPAFDFTALRPPALAMPESTTLDALPAPARREAFFRLWTRKEAVAKALGLGVAAFDAGLDLSALPAAESTHALSVSALGQSCNVCDLPGGRLPAGYVAALAQLRS
jgi:phosphopantetheinyl transferase